MVIFCRMFFCLFTILVLLPSASHADWINLSGAENARNIAEIHVETDRVRIQLEVFVDDLMIFEELIPEGFFSEPLPGRPSLAKRQQIFAERVLFSTIKFLLYKRRELQRRDRAGFSPDFP